MQVVKYNFHEMKNEKEMIKLNFQSEYHSMNPRYKFLGIANLRISDSLKHVLLVLLRNLSLELSVTTIL